MSSISIKRALIAVYDKTGIADFARALVDEFGIEIISTGGTAKHLKEAGIAVTMVEDVTGFPELLDGRVKTLHPKIHAGILADRDNPKHMRQLAEHGILPIDMVVVNLYPFEETVKDPACKFEDAIEMIDIGGPCMLRAAAKNHRHVLVCPNTSACDRVLREWRTRGVAPFQFAEGLASEVFEMTAAYDDVVNRFLDYERSKGAFYPTLVERLYLQSTIRYGENPHQAAARYSLSNDEPTGFQLAHRLIRNGESISFNNYVDANAAMALCSELSRAKQALWHRFSTGVGHGVDAPISDERHTRRNLPHIQKPEATYFVTFRIRSGKLSESERSIVLHSCCYWHGKKVTVHAAVVMPDHVHLLMTPHEIDQNRWVSLGELIPSIKRHSAQQINRNRGRTGSLWLDEYFDRVMRDEKEFTEKWEYIEANPVTAGIHSGEDYPWFWKSDTGFMETVESSEHRLKTGATARADARHLSLANETEPSSHTCVFIKHTNACGVGVDRDPVEAYRRAYLGDPNAAMGGILAVDFNVDTRFAEMIMGTLQNFKDDAIKGGCANPPQAFFAEVIVAPSFDKDAVEVIRTRKKWGERVRLLEVGDTNVPPSATDLDYKRIAGGMLVQTPDLLGLNEPDWSIATEREPTDDEMADARLAWLTCKHTKSNAITICKKGMLIGNGAGQMSRVMSCRIATWLAKENGHADKLAGSVAASDAFFPFRDGLDILADAGVTTVIQPGGSKRDDEVIAAANERGIAMIMTGTRHFKH